MSDAEWGISSVASVSVRPHTALSWGCSEGRFINEALGACPRLAWLLMSWACLACDGTDSCCQVRILRRESTDSSRFVPLLMAPSVRGREWAQVLPLVLMSPEPCRAFVTCTGQPLPPPLFHRAPPHPSLGYRCGQDWLMKKHSEDDIYDLPARPRKYLGIWQFTDA